MLCVPGEAWGNNHIVDSGANDSVTIKRISRSRVDAGIDLIPDNKKFQPIHCTLEELELYQALVPG